MSQFIGQAADGVAQAVLATELVLDPLAEGTPEKILALFALTLLPYSLLSPFMGVFVDRWDRRRLLIGTNLLRSGLLFTLPLWSRALPGDGPLLLGILALLGLGRLFQTTKGATLPVVVHDRHLLQANTVSSVGGTLSAVAGAGVGLWIARLLDAETALAATGLLYLPAAGGAARIRADLTRPHVPPEALGAALGRVARELVAGLRAILVRPPAAISLGSIFALRVLTMVVIVAVVLLIKAEFTGTAASSGVALAAAGAGALIGAVAAPALGRRLKKPRVILVGFVVSACGIVALGGIPVLPAVAALMAIGGFAGFIVKVAVDAQIQESLPDAYRGRAFALYDILYNVASVVAGLALVVSQAAGLRGVLLVTGVINFLFAGLLLAAMRRAGMLSPALRPPQKVLETDRMVLRRLTAADLDDLAALLGDDDVMRYYSRPKTRDEARRWLKWNLEMYEREGFGLWALELKGTGEFVGECGLVVQEVDGRREIEIGYHLKKSHWRRGLASEAARACRDYAFFELGVERVISIISPDNLPSQKVAEKIGMRLQKQSNVFGHPSLIFAIDRPRKRRP